MSCATNQNRSIPNIVSRAARMRASGRWPEWRHHSTPDGVPGAEGWGKDVFRCSENGIFSVLMRDVETPWGTVRHLTIALPVNGQKPTWAEKQRIKDELLGRERIAIEVFPRASELVDGADAFHLWCLPAGMDLPFNLHTETKRHG